MPRRRNPLARANSPEQFIQTIRGELNNVRVRSRLMDGGTAIEVEQGGVSQRILLSRVASGQRVSGFR